MSDPQTMAVEELIDALTALLSAYRNPRSTELHLRQTAERFQLALSTWKEQGAPVSAGAYRDVTRQMESLKREVRRLNDQISTLYEHIDACHAHRGTLREREVNGSEQEAPS